MEIVVMSTSDPNSENESREMEYRKVIVNIPKPMLDELDLVCKMKFYTRKEAIKEAIRGFTQSVMGEEWVSPIMQKYEKELVSDYMEGVTVGLARASQNPEIKKIQQKNAQLQATSTNTNQVHKK